MIARAATRARRERGATGLEYAGFLAIAALVVALIALTILRTDVTGRTTAAVCRLFQGENCQTVGQNVETALERALKGEYVAMGDSFASGEGAGDYSSDTDYDHRDDFDPRNWGDDLHNRCHRSGNNYAQTIYKNNPFAGNLTVVSCSGAQFGADVDPSTTDDENDDALGGPQPGEDGTTAQKDALSDKTSLVTLSIGGNDLGFGDVVQACVINGERGVPFAAKCQETWDAELDRRLEVLGPQLVAQYLDIKNRAPNARIVIMGYPQLFNDPPSDSITNLLYAEDQAWMNGKADRLNEVIRQACREAGVEFVDPTEAFQGHGLGSNDPWINDLTFGGPGFTLVNKGSFHPNATGQAEMARLLQEQLENPQYP